MAARGLKADLHAHAADDPRDTLAHSAEMLIDQAAQAGVQVLAITLHESFFQVERLRRYAAERGVLLIPGLELMVEGKHVLVLNPDDAQIHCTTFAELRGLGSREGAIIAPHPFFPAPVCLGGKLVQHIDLFDAIEYSTMYCRGINFNAPAVWLAKKHSLPLVGTSDTHTLPYVDSTHSLLHCEPTVEGVIDAIRNGRIELVTRPRTHRHAMRFGFKVMYDSLRDVVAGAA